MFLRVSVLLLLQLAAAVVAAVAPFPSLRVPPTELQQMLRADIRRRYTELFALGWLGRAYLTAPPLFDALLPAVFRLEVYSEEEGAACYERAGTVEMTLRERSVVSRGIPFRLLLEKSDVLTPPRLTSARLLGIGPQLRRAAQKQTAASPVEGAPSCREAPGAGARAGGADEGSGAGTELSTTAARELCDLINEDPAAKSLVVRAVVATIFERLSRVRRATEAAVELRARGAEVAFEPCEQLWAREGSAEKWLQCVCGYWFASASVQDVQFVGAVAEDVSFSFYLDPAEPLNSDDPTQNVNPEVICCDFN